MLSLATLSFGRCSALVKPRNKMIWGRILGFDFWVFMGYFGGYYEKASGAEISVAGRLSLRAREVNDSAIGGSSIGIND